MEVEEQQTEYRARTGALRSAKRLHDSQVEQLQNQEAPARCEFLGLVLELAQEK